MPALKVLYTIGHLPTMTISNFMNIMKKFGINCLVDIREPNGDDKYGEFSSNKLNAILKANGIHYLPFYDEFGRYERDVCKPSGVPDYNKVIISGSFKKGIERLENGSNKGFTVAVLNYNVNPAHCNRFKLIGRFLTEQDWKVYHILEDGNAITQIVLEEKIGIVHHNTAEKKLKSAELGQIGEELAAQYLMLNGYTILDHNWNLHRGCEIDIIAFKDNRIHAIEVKTRSDNSVIAPEQAIDEKKLKNINKALQQYRKEKHIMNIEAQIDSIAIVMKNKNDYSINMYEDLRLRYTWRY